MRDEVSARRDKALRDYLAEIALVRRERLVVEQREDEWVAELRAASRLAGEIVAGASILPDEVIVLAAKGSDRRTAMVRLVDLVTTAAESY
jgi:hypothetical protein